ncbi:restriction endonuclease [Kitasatospora purpeofusca]|uniref:restriction endonuclease n=1 Tax=Kitasatospora purpeofusca TaxID=67352 RepID=UPI002E0EBE61|nr:restriction endonuclease [Kitasatospora purpeofusca]WSR41853.1 restriction endonuclease [Kitasatospora purpeofusca]
MSEAAAKDWPDREEPAFSDAVIHLPPGLTAWPSPRGFELYVEQLARQLGDGLVDLHVGGLEPVVASDGTSYTMDVVARFRAFGLAEFVTLWECKRLQRPVERGDLQILRDKLAEVGAHKGIFVSVSGFQSGALDYAKKHGIATVQLVDQVARFSTFSENTVAPSSRVEFTWVVGRYATWHFHGEDTADAVEVAEQHPGLLRDTIGLPFTGASAHLPGCADCSRGTRIVRGRCQVTRARGVQPAAS